jgi:fructokinase
MKTPRYRIGIDLGGTKIEAIALAPDGRELLRQRVPTPKEDYRGTVAAIAGLVAKVEAELGEPATVGVGMPGAISPATGLVKNANSTWLNGQPFDRDLAAAVGRELRLENDANCLAVSEATDGAAAGEPLVFGVIIGTGVGGGIAFRGEAWRGANAIAGEWGHIPIQTPRDDERPGPACYCGRFGCVETLLSGPGMLREYNATAPAAAAKHVKDVVQRAEAGEVQAAAALDRYEDRLARCLATVINILDPSVIVLGGGVSNVARLYQNVPRLWARWVFSDRVATPLRQAKHGDSSGVRGAAWLWPPASGMKGDAA